MRVIVLMPLFLFIFYRAFHVFKVFVANPNKPAKIRLILYNNKQKLCTYLTNFHQDKEEEDSQFSEEKKLLIA
jgi:calcium binding protein 39